MFLFFYGHPEEDIATVLIKCTGKCVVLEGNMPVSEQIDFFLSRKKKNVLQNVSQSLSK